MEALMMPHRLLYRPKETPAGNEWPFRICGDFIEWFNLKHMDWIQPEGVPDDAGYIMMNWKLPDGKRRFLRLHNVVWETHNGPVPIGLEIDHMDMNKANNLITNLRLVTHAQNIRLAREQLGNWSAEALTKIKPHQLELLLALPPSWRCLRYLAVRWGMNKYTLGNLRAKAKKGANPRYLAGL